MKSDPDPTDDDDVETDRLIDEMFGRANPNPSRHGCPTTAVLFELAHRQRDLYDPWWNHLTKCSPCYREFMALRESSGDVH